jgi:hypothetical protein
MSDIRESSGCDRGAEKLFTSMEVGKNSTARVISPATIHTLALIFLAPQTNAEINSQAAIAITSSQAGPRDPQKKLADSHHPRVNTIRAMIYDTFIFMATPPQILVP